MRKLLFFLSIIILTSCNGIYDFKPVTPGGLTATGANDEETSRIILTWDNTANAGVYYLYRSESETGTYEIIGQTADLEFADTDIIFDTPYYYQISAANLWGKNESALSSPVMGITHEFNWDTEAISVASSGGQAIMAVVNRNLYIYYLDPNNNIQIRIYDPNEDDETLQWDDSIASPGRASTGGVYDITRSSQSYYAVFSDNSNGGMLAVKSYNSEDNTWESVGDITAFQYDGAPFDGVPDIIPNTAGTTAVKIRYINNTLYAAFIDSTANVFVARYNEDFNEWRETGRQPIDADNAGGADASAAITELQLEAYNNGPLLSYIYNNSGYIPTVIRYTEEGWAPLGGTFPTAPNSAANLIIYPSGLHAAFLDSAGAPHVRQYAGEAWKYLDADGSYAAVSPGAISPGAMAIAEDDSGDLVVIGNTASGAKAIKWTVEKANIEDDVSKWGDIADPAVPATAMNFCLVNIGRELYLLYSADDGALELLTYK